MGQQPLGLDASAVQSMPVSITTHWCDLTWLQVLFRQRCPVFMLSQEKALHHGAATFLRNTACLHPTTPHSLYLQETLTLTHTFWKNSLPSSLGNSQLSWSDESRASSRVKSCCHLPHHLRNLRQQQEADFLLCPLHPHPRSPHWGLNFSPYAATHWPNLHLLKQHLATDVFGVTWLFSRS